MSASPISLNFIAADIHLFFTAPIVPVWGLVMGSFPVPGRISWSGTHPHAGPSQAAKCFPLWDGQRGPILARLAVSMFHYCVCCGNSQGKRQQDLPYVGGFA